MLALIVGEAGESPFEVFATNNIFSLDGLFWSRRPMGGSAKEMVRWQSASNLYSVGLYARATPSIETHEDWVSSDATEMTASLPVELGIRARLYSLTQPTREEEAAAFRLTIEEHARLAALGVSDPDAYGADLSQIGPGEPYAKWRQSPAYQRWLNQVNALLQKKP